MTSDFSGLYYDNVVEGDNPTGDAPLFIKFEGEPKFWFYACHYTPVSYGKF